MGFREADVPMLEAHGLWELVERRAAETPDGVFAMDDAGRRIDFAGYRDTALRCAAGLNALGVTEGTRVSWQLPTTIDAMIPVVPQDARANGGKTPSGSPVYVLFFFCR